MMFKNASVTIYIYSYSLNTTKMVTEQLLGVRKVVKVLSKHGFGGILCDYGFSWCVPFFKRKDPVPDNVPEKLRDALEELGGAYFKLGQMLSLRPDLVPQEFCKEFSKLSDNALPDDIEEIEKIIEHEFKNPANVIFKHIDPRPLGSTIISQVHKARLPSGEAVAVKVQRMHIAEQFAKDISTINFVAQKFQNHWSKSLDIMQEFENYVKQELDFTKEAQNLEELKEIKNVLVPKVFRSHTTEKILTTEYLEGIKLANFKGVQKDAAQLIVDAFLEQVFKAGVFHVNLSPENILLMKNGKIGLLGCSIVGRISESDKKLYVELYKNILQNKRFEIAELLLKYRREANVDVVKFAKEVDNLISNWWQLSDKKITDSMYQLFILCLKHSIALPYNILLLGNALMAVESTIKQLDPEGNFVQYSEKKLKSLFGKLPKLVKELGAVNFKTLPENEVNIHHRPIEKDKKSYTCLSYALFCAALILASAVFANRGPIILGYPLLSSLSLLLASFFLLAMLLSLKRHNLHEVIS